MKKISVALLGMIGGYLFAATQADFDEYLPLARKIQAGEYTEGITGLEKIAQANEFAAVTLYLIYTRGYCERAVDYQKAVSLYFDPWLGTSFHFQESIFWGGKYFPPLDGCSSVVMRNEYGKIRVTLKGTHSLKKCYTEQMLNIGGLVPRAVFEVASPNRDLHGSALEFARKTGNPRALLFSPSDNKTGRSRTPQERRSQINRLEEAVKLGYVPSMIELARILQQKNSGIPDGYHRAGELLKTAENELLKYSTDGCTHTRKDLATVQRMLRSVPDFKKTTPELLEDLRKTWRTSNPDPLLIAALSDEIGRRNDHVECAFYRIQSQLDNPQTRAAAIPEAEKAAEAGSPTAINYLLHAHDLQQKRYFYYYLAGKFGVQNSECKTPNDFYRKALLLLKEQRLNFRGREYRSGLQLLSGVLPEAKEEYDREFSGEEGKEERISIRVAHRQFATPEWFDLQGHKALRIVVKACDQPNYLDFTLKPVAGKKFFALFLHSNTNLASNEVWVDISLPDGSRRRSHVNSSYQGIQPKRFRLNIAPTKKNFELIITGM